jgi:hypothetical protein
VQLQTMGNPIHKTHCDLDIAGPHHFLPITYFVIGDGGYNEKWKNPKTPKNEVSKFLLSYESSNLWVFNSYIWILIKDFSRAKLYL